MAQHGHFHVVFDVRDLNLSHMNSVGSILSYAHNTSYNNNVINLPPQIIQPVMSMPVRRLKFETKACVFVSHQFYIFERPAEEVGN